jgi:hypothetical protein
VSSPDYHFCREDLKRLLCLGAAGDRPRSLINTNYGTSEVLTEFYWLLKFPEAKNPSNRVRSIIPNKAIPQSKSVGLVKVIWRFKSEASEAIVRLCRREEIEDIWCRRGDSNPHELPHTPLKRARLPVPPLRPLLVNRESEIVGRESKTRTD